jgi:hypothetical protein
MFKMGLKFFLARIGHVVFNFFLACALVRVGKMVRENFLGFMDHLARIFALGFKIFMARTKRVGFMCHMARNPSMGFNCCVARIWFVGFSRYMAGVVDTRNREVGFMYHMARTLVLGFNGNVARIFRLGFTLDAVRVGKEDLTGQHQTPPLFSSSFFITSSIETCSALSSCIRACNLSSSSYVSPSTLTVAMLSPQW